MITIYMQYTCKNKKCQRAFIDEDLRGRMTPETWKYCPECVEKHGFINPIGKPNKKLSAKQKKVLKNNQFGLDNKHSFCMRKNTSFSNEKSEQVVIYPNRFIKGKNEDYFFDVK